MKKIVYIPLLIGTPLFLVGGVLVGCNVGQNKGITVTHDITESFSKISMDLSTSDVEFIVTTDGTKKVECVESKRVKHSVSVEEDTLKIASEGKKKWYEFFQPSFKVKLYVPASNFTSLNINIRTGDTLIPSGFEFGSVDVKSSTGDVTFKSNVTNKLNVVQSTGDLTLSDVSAGEIYLESSTGRKNLSDVSVLKDVTLKASTGDSKINKLTCANLTINSSTGDVKITDSVMSKDLFIKCSTGDVDFLRSDAQKINVETSTGDVELSLLSEHDISAHTDTGHVDYPAHSDGPDCDITTDTGDIKVTFVN